MKLIQFKTSNGIILIGIGILGVEIGNKIKFFTKRTGGFCLMIQYVPLRSETVRVLEVLSKF